MNRDAMHEGPEIVDQGASVVVGTGVARHPFRQRVDGRDMAIQGCRMQGHRDGGFRKRGPFRLDTLSSLVQLCNALPLALDPIALRLQSRARCGRSGKPCRASSSELIYLITRSMLRCPQAQGARTMLLR
ncbi:hypothetical protein [Bradyrhizobium sp. SZCCHNR1093]|uniref:hypothetical protein n=1 Tax=Bradyrhizobium sp. SZCCHNR1093 TaxID=3057368 RepID=UPI0028E51C98|nr:hypothetical protein [Bradyrhizobium sp. SZCCHNR1093]